MDILWMLHAPFWQKMYFAGTAAGVATFIYLMFETITLAKRRFRAWLADYRVNGWPLIVAETTSIIHSMISKITQTSLFNASSELVELSDGKDSPHEKR